MFSVHRRFLSVKIIYTVEKTIIHAMANVNYPLNSHSDRFLMANFFLSLHGPDIPSTRTHILSIAILAVMPSPGCQSDDIASTAVGGIPPVGRLYLGPAPSIPELIEDRMSIGSIKTNPSVRRKFKVCGAAAP